MAVRRIVVFGGTFDPVHIGHLAVARSLLNEMDADRVVMVPAGRPWLRVGQPVATPQDRLSMVKLATENELGIDASNVDVVRTKTTYSLDTISDLKRVYGEDAEYVLAIGSDAASDLHRWHRYDELIQLCRFVVVERPGSPAVDLTNLPPGTEVLRGPMVDASASKIRTLYRDGLAVEASTLVPDTVHRFIIERGLYRCITPKQ